MSDDEDSQGFARFYDAYEVSIGDPRARQIEVGRLRRPAELCDEILDVIAIILGDRYDLTALDTNAWHVRVNENMKAHPDDIYIVQLWRNLPRAVKEGIFLDPVSYEQVMSWRDKRYGDTNRSRPMSSTDIGRSRIQLVPGDVVLRVFSQLPAYNVLSILDSEGLPGTVRRDALLLLLDRDIVDPMNSGEAKELPVTRVVHDLTNIRASMTQESFVHALELYHHLTERLGKWLAHAALSVFALTNRNSVFKRCYRIRLQGRFFTMDFHQRRYKPEFERPDAPPRIVWKATTRSTENTFFPKLPGALGRAMVKFAGTDAQRRFVVVAETMTGLDQEVPEFVALVTYIVQHIDPSVRWVGSVSSHHLWTPYYFRLPGRVDPALLKPDSIVIGPETRYHIVADRLGPPPEMPLVAAGVPPSTMAERVLDDDSQ